MKGMLKSQGSTTKRCDCGRGTIFTGLNANHSPKVDGKRVCEECMVEYLYEQFYKRREEQGVLQVSDTKTND